MINENASSLRSDEAMQCLELAYVAEEQKEFERALKECEAAIRIDPSLADAHNFRGVVLEYLGRKEEAAQAYMKALDLDPEFQVAAKNLAELRLELAARHEGEERLVTIATFSQAAEAHVSSAKLRASGVWSFVADESTVTANWLLSGAMGGVKLKVRESNVGRALEILDLEVGDIESEEEELDGEDDETRCPNCSSSNIRYERFAKRGVFSSWLLLGFPIPFLKRKWRCRDCGYEWKR